LPSTVAIGNVQSRFLGLIQVDVQMIQAYPSCFCVWRLTFQIAIAMVTPGSESPNQPELQGEIECLVVFGEGVSQ